MPPALPMVNGGDVVTDARLPERWLHDRRFLRLSDSGFRLFAVSLMWSVAHRTDGLMDPADIPIMPCGDSPDTRQELLDRELWLVQGDSYLINDFDRTQTSAAQLAGLDQKREGNNARQKRHRSKQSEKPEKSSGVTRDITRDTAGQDRRGQDSARTGREVDGSENERFSGSDADQFADSARLDRSSDDHDEMPIGKCSRCAYREPLMPDGRCRPCFDWDVPEEEAS